MKVQVSHRSSGSGIITTICYDRQKKLNSLNKDGILKLAEVFSNLKNNSDLRAVVLTGAGSTSFFGGADIYELNDLNPETGRAFIKDLHSLFVQIRTFPVPVIARINGYTLGAGMELAAACDLRIGSETSIFGMPEVRVGIPSVIEAALLPRLIGWGRSNYLVMTAENIDATKAYDWGFLESIVPIDELDSETDRIANAIAASGPIAVRAQKRLVQKWEELPLGEAITAGVDALADAFKTSEPQRMMRPFFERKKS